MYRGCQTFITADGIDITRIVILHRIYHGKVIKMPKEDKLGMMKRRAEWDIRRRLMKDQQPYKGSDTEKEHKKAGEKKK